MKITHFVVGNKLKGTVSAMDTRELTMEITEVVKKRPLTFRLRTIINPHRSAFETSLFGSGIEKGARTVTDAELQEYVHKGWFTTDNMEIQKTYKTFQMPKIKVRTVDSDAEYWNYVHDYGSEEEKAEAAEYFDVTPAAFDDDYETAMR